MNVSIRIPRTHRMVRRPAIDSNKNGDQVSTNWPLPRLVAIRTGCEFCFLTTHLQRAFFALHLFTSVYHLMWKTNSGATEYTMLVAETQRHTEWHFNKSCWFRFMDSKITFVWHMQISDCIPCKLVCEWLAHCVTSNWSEINWRRTSRTPEDLLVM